MSIELINYILAILSTSGILVIAWCMRTAKPAPQTEEELLVTEHKILLNHKITNIWVEDGEVFFIYE